MPSKIEAIRETRGQLLPVFSRVTAGPSTFSRTRENREQFAVGSSSVPLLDIPSKIKGTRETRGQFAPGSSPVNTAPANVERFRGTGGQFATFYPSANTSSSEIEARKNRARFAAICPRVTTIASDIEKLEEVEEVEEIEGSLENRRPSAAVSPPAVNTRARTE